MERKYLPGIYSITGVPATVVICLLLGCGGSDPKADSGNSGVDSDPSTQTAKEPKGDGEKSGETGSSSKGSSSDPNTSSSKAGSPKAKASGGTKDLADWQKFVPMLITNDVAQKSKARQFVEGHEQGETMKTMVQLLGDSAPEVRRGAAFYLLGEFQSSDADTRKALLLRLDDSDRQVRTLAVQAVQRSDRATQIAQVEKLGKLLAASKDVNLKLKLIRVLAGLQMEAEKALPTLVTTFTDDADQRVRKASLAAIYQIAKAEESAKILSRILSEAATPIEVKRLAIVRLGNLRFASPEVLSKLGALLADDNKDVGDAAAEALYRMETKGMFELAKHLESKSVVARRRAVKSLGQMGAGARSQYEPIRKRLADPDKEVRDLAKEALAQIRPM